MNRVIKFRAWDGEEMLYPSEMNPAITIAPECDDSTLIYSLEWSPDGDMENAKVSVIRGVSMQFTGLKDKNGVDCYESDIVRYKNGAEYSVAEVTYGLSEFRLTTSKGWHSFSVGYPDIEVIGNIHQHSELLE